MNLRKEKGSIAIFVLVALLFMSAFLIILYASNVNKSKVVKEQFDIISGIYAYGGGDEAAYDKVYNDLRKKSKRVYSYTNKTDAGKTIFENAGSVELKRTSPGKIIDYRIYGNTEHTVIRYTPTLANQGFIPLDNGATYPTTNTTYPNATYEIIEIKQGQKLTFNYTGTGANKLRVRCIDSTTNKVVGDLVHTGGGEVTETDYYTTTIYYYHSTPDNGVAPEGYVIAKKDFKIGIMYIDTKPDDFNLLIYGNTTKEVGDLVNLFDPSKTYGGSIFTNKQYIYNETTSFRTAFLKVKPNTTYYYSSDTSELSTGILSINLLYNVVDPTQYTGDNILTIDKQVFYSGGTASSRKFTTDENTKMVAITYCRYTSPKNIQLEEGSEPTEYTPYGKYRIPIKLTKENGESIVKNIYLDEPLRRNKYSTDYIYSDYIDFKNQKVVRVNKKIVVDGNEEVWGRNTNRDDYDVITIRYFKVKDAAVNSGFTLISEQYDFLGAIWNYGNSSNSWRIGGYNNTIYISIDNKTLGVTTENTAEERTQKVKDYVTANNFWVVYPLATPEEEYIDIPELDTFEDYTKIEILTELEPAKIELEYEGYSINRLPDEYAALEYIESTGTQYILTDIIPNDNIGASIEFYMDSTSGDTIFLGSRSISSGRFWMGQNAGKFYYGWNTLTSVSSRPRVEAKNRIIAQNNYLNSRKQMYNGTLFQEITSEYAGNTQPMTIFAGNDNGNIVFYSKIRIYSLIITEGNRVIADFKPCYRKEDGEIGLYNAQTDEFYENVGTGEFIAGPEY